MGGYRFCWLAWRCTKGQPGNCLLCGPTQAPRVLVQSTQLERASANSVA